MAQISSTMGVQGQRVCIGDGSRGDIGCPGYAPYVNATNGFVGIGDISGPPMAALTVSGNVIVSGTARFTSPLVNQYGFMLYDGAFALSLRHAL